MGDQSNLHPSLNRYASNIQFIFETVGTLAVSCSVLFIFRFLEYQGPRRCLRKGLLTNRQKVVTLRSRVRAGEQFLHSLVAQITESD